MSYSYKTQRPDVFTEAGVDALLAVRERAKSLIAMAGACTDYKALEGIGGDSWTLLACLDYLVERGELRRTSRDVLEAGLNFNRGKV